MLLFNNGVFDINAVKPQSHYEIPPIRSDSEQTEQQKLIRWHSLIFSVDSHTTAPGCEEDASENRGDELSVHHSSSFLSSRWQLKFLLLVSKIHHVWLHHGSAGSFTRTLCHHDSVWRRCCNRLTPIPAAAAHIQFESIMLHKHSSRVPELTRSLRFTSLLVHYNLPMSHECEAGNVCSLCGGAS